MVLAIDIGNTNIKIGLFSGAELLQAWRLSSNTTRTSDEYGVAILNILRTHGVKAQDIEGVIISSVIPNLNYTIEHAVKQYFGKKPLIVGDRIKTGLNIKYDNPKEVGADRIVNSVAALKLYGAPLIVIDFGTATTFNVISDSGEFLGGMICPGMKTSTESLTSTAAKLPRIELKRPPTVINKSTVTNMQAGVIYGFTGMTEYLINKIREETGYTDAKVVVTGGLSELISGHSKIIDVFDRALTLKGLNIIYGLNDGRQGRNDK